MFFMYKGTLIYGDGSSIGNPGPGGWGAVIRFSDGRVKEIGGFEQNTTNNRMELLSAIKALSEVVDLSIPVEIRTDSRYVINGITKWISLWEKSGWKTKAKKDVLNRDLWEKLHMLNQRFSVTWHYVPGHSGVLGNERVDTIAQSFARGEEVSLYDGPLSGYGTDLDSVVVQKPFYISYVDGVFKKHDNWFSCEHEVRGKKAARFKKITSVADARIAGEMWGVSKAELERNFQ